jgi:hypothetical protein
VVWFGYCVLDYSLSFGLVWLLGWVVVWFGYCDGLGV